MNNQEIFLNLNQEKINVIIANEENKSPIYVKNFNVENDFDDIKTVINNLSNILKNLIIELEKKINHSVNEINLMIDNPDTLSINISVKKNYDNKKIFKNQIEYLIQDLKQQVLRNNPDIKIAHIIVKNCFVDNEEFNTLPIGVICKDLIIQVQFICFSKNFIHSLQNLFETHQIKFKKIICTNYAKSLLDTDLDNLSEAGLKVINGFNMNEVQISPKKLTKVGFFERLFHIFS